MFFLKEIFPTIASYQFFKNARIFINRGFFSGKNILKKLVGNDSKEKFYFKNHY